MTHTRAHVLTQHKQIGSLYTGDFERAKEFYNLTREHLGYVFDVTDYNLALVLIPLSFLARYW